MLTEKELHGDQGLDPDKFRAMALKHLSRNSYSQFSASTFDTLGYFTNSNVHHNDIEVIPLPSNSIASSNTSILPIPLPVGNWCSKPKSLSDCKAFQANKQYNASPLNVVKSEIHLLPHTSNQPYRVDKTKSGNKRPVKSRLKDKKHERCFTVLTAPASTSEKFKNQSDFVNKISRKCCYTSGGFDENENKSNLSSLPATEQKICYANTSKTKRHTTLQPSNDCNTTNFFISVQKPRLQFVKNKGNINLPPALYTNSPLDVLKTDQLANSNILERKAVTSHSSRKDRKNISLETRALRLPQSGNNLGDRLSLIHTYGLDFETLALQRKLEEQRRLAMIRREFKQAERKGKERRKTDQRKKIYALNCLMTRLENEQFNQFMSGLAAAPTTLLC